VLGAGWLSARAIRPIAAMTATAEAISAQNLSERIDVSDTDSELGKLATVLNGSFDRLQAAVERQRQFTADASHELRTPLSVIAAHTELALSRERSSEDYQATIETCWRASQRMKSLIDSLLLLARFDSGTPSMNRDRVNLDSLIRECVELVEPLATARGIQIECQTVPSPVWGDSDRLLQVITNLLTNAIRYNVDGGSIRVSNRVESESVVISVTDSGVGIAEDQLPRIFDRFYQVDKARSRAEGSCGLGLSICKTIVEAHGGTITATSQIAAGTTVQVRLPIGDLNETPAELESNERRLASSFAET
jgi:heavy metal sensor kinase